MKVNIKYSTSLLKVELFCASEEYLGWDPFDGLNSHLLQLIPFLNSSTLVRLAWIQAFKRNPVNIRRLFLVPKGHNPKGIALFLSGYCSLLKYQRNTGSNDFGTETELLDKITNLCDLLISLRSHHLPHTSNRIPFSSCLKPHASCLSSSWGYNFDWQARRLFLFPKYTPTVVATSFCASSLFDAYEATGEERYLKTALSSAGFILNDLHRTQRKDGFLFSYSPLKGNDTVYNASLLGTRLLSQCWKHTGDNHQSEAARSSAKACCEAQNSDGSWYYGELPVQKWIDSFHTGYNLEALYTYQKMTGDNSFAGNIEKGFDFYLNNFFLPDGTPKYYHSNTYPIDIHCPAQLIITLCRTGRLEQHRELADKVLEWTIKHMQDRSGYFYYQKSKYYTNKISYMRWSNAFMFNAMSEYLLSAAK